MLVATDGVRSDCGRWPHKQDAKLGHGRQHGRQLQYGVICLQAGHESCLASVPCHTHHPAVGTSCDWLVNYLHLFTFTCVVLSFGVMPGWCCFLRATHTSSVQAVVDSNVIVRKPPWHNEASIYRLGDRYISTRPAHGGLILCGEVPTVLGY